MDSYINRKFKSPLHSINNSIVNRIAGKLLNGDNIDLINQTSKVFNIRITADTDNTRAAGLMFAAPLEDDECAYFIFPHDDSHGFWNHNVSFPLTLAFCNQSGRIVDIGDMEAGSRKILSPDSNQVRYVAECKKGTLTKKAIGGFLDHRQGKLYFTPPN